MSTNLDASIFAISFNFYQRKFGISLNCFAIQLNSLTRNQFVT